MNRRNPIVTIVVALLVVWVLLAIIGVVVKGLFWLFVIGLVLFAVTAVGGGMRNRR